MPTVRNPTTFSKQFSIDPKRLRALGVLDPTLAVDTKLFIDPLLLRRSRHTEMKVQGVELYRRHFETVIRLLKAAVREGDPAWKAAAERLRFPEIRGTCLGYGAESIHGRGFGSKLANRVTEIAHQIVGFGIEDPDLFPALALFEEKIGSDRISDLATNILRPALVAFNRRVLQALGLEGHRFELKGTGGSVRGVFLRNPLQDEPTPIVLVPRDVLRKLPIALDWDDVAHAAAKNEQLRTRVNRHIGHMWAATTRREKERLRDQALRGREAFQALLDAVHGVTSRAYDLDADPEGLLVWARRGEEYAAKYPLRLARSSGVPMDSGAIMEIVSQIIEQFRHLIEQRGLNQELYQPNGKRRHERTAQRLFFAVAYAYCKANNVDVSPELDVGTGKVDFKFSTAFDARVLVEVKLSSNGQLVPGYEKQLDVYKRAEETMKAVYLVLDVGSLKKKDVALTKKRNAALKRGEPASALEFVDGRRRPTASKR